VPTAHRRLAIRPLLPRLSQRGPGGGRVRPPARRRGRAWAAGPGERQAAGARQAELVHCVAPIVERYHGTYNRECLQVDRPATLEQAREVTAAFREHYNRERPNQARSCRNRPPLVAFPALPPRPPVPPEVDPDAWLGLVAGRRYPRKVAAGGMLRLDNERYFVGRRWAGQRVTVAVDAAAGDVVIRHGGAVVKHLRLRGLRGGWLPFERYVELMGQEAVTQARRARWAALARAAAA
jgi:hypothetical protein